MKHLLIVTALMELGAGLALICWPSVVAALLLGSPLETPAAQTIARLGGAALLSLGIACGLAWGEEQSREGRGIVVAMLVYNLAAVVLFAAVGIGAGLVGIALWPAIILHAMMTIWCVAFLRRGRA